MCYNEFIEMNKRSILPLVFILLCGCAKVQHMDQLLTLKAVSDEQAAMSKEVEAVNKKFDELVSIVKSGEISQYKTQRSVRKKFGDPILIDQQDKDGSALQVWLYRYATKFFGSDKVYLYFDTEGNLKNWDYVQAKEEVQNEQIRQETPG